MNSSKKPKASNIFKKNMDNSYENTKSFLENLLSNIEIKCNDVGQSFEYPEGIIENNTYLQYGIFMNYFIRKYLSNKYQTDLNDIAVEKVLQRPDVYFKDQNLKQRIADEYHIYQNPQNNAMDILDSIKFLPAAFSATYNETKVDDELTHIHSDNEMLREIIKHLDSLPYNNVELTPCLQCDHYIAVPDIIFNNGEVLYDIKTSKFVTSDRNDTTFSPANFYVLIADAYCYYKNRGIKILNFIIYNPLLGYEYEMKMNDIDFEEFERCLQRDAQ